MKKPWQIWTAFVVCLAALILAMLWLSFKTIEMDMARENDRTETEIARRQAELQERISSALYRMDLKLLPLVSQEASRPHYLYEPFYKASSPTGLTSKEVNRNQEAGPSYPKIPSPLLIETPDLVLVHFQLRADESIASPQFPMGLDHSRALEILGKQFDPKPAATQLKMVQRFCRYETLLDRCPDCPEPQTPSDATGGVGEFEEVFPRKGGPQKLAQLPQQKGSFYNSPVNEKVSGNLGTQKYQAEVPQGSKVAIQQSRSKMRASDEFNQRLETTREQVASINKNFLSNNIQYQQGYGEFNSAPDIGLVEQGVMQPIWLENELLLFRRIDSDGEPFFQCCWLDWEAIKNQLRTAVADLLPEVEFEPVKADTDLNTGTALTTLPIQLIVDSQKLMSTLSIGESTSTVKDGSGLKMALLLSWLGIGLAAVASALLLNGVMKLSERRASFVSAVTHELRTPLTTFRMYSEMLAERMVPPEKQQDYANTLRLQADRLSHLVENVLQFARLERSAAKPSTETVLVDDLIERFSGRLTERASESDMKLMINIADDVSGTSIETHSSSIEQVLFNLVDNACKYAKPNSRNLIELNCNRVGKALQFSVRDYGPGVAPKFKKTMFQPFSKSDIDAANSAPGVGLGLALCRRMAHSQGGRLFHESQTDGAKFVLELPL